jgi:hypothetical protein
MAEHFRINNDEGKWLMMAPLPDLADIEQAYYVDRFYDVIKRSVGDTVRLIVDVSAFPTEENIDKA